MKTLINLLAFALLFQGCAIVQTDGKIDPVKLSTVAELASYQTAYWWLKGNPKDRDKFEAASARLGTLIAQDTGSVVDLQKLLMTLPVGAFKSSENDGALYWNTFTILWTAYGKQVELEDPANVKPVMEGLARGLKLAL